MDLFEIKLRFGVSRSHSVEINRLFKMVTSFKYYTRYRPCLILQEVTIEKRSTIHKSFNLPVNLETSNVRNLSLACEVSNFHLFVFSPANNPKNCCFTVKRSFSGLNCLSKDGMSKCERRCRLCT